jgi:hypothetical protein
MTSTDITIGNASSSLFIDTDNFGFVFDGEAASTPIEFTDAITSVRLEGDTDDAWEIVLDWEDATVSDKTVTLPNLTGRVLVGGADNVLTGTSMTPTLALTDNLNDIFLDFDEVAGTKNIYFRSDLQSTEPRMTVYVDDGTSNNSLIVGSEVTRLGSTNNMVTFGTSTFANLGTGISGLGNGMMVYCSDCTKATPCAGSGTGALAKRYAGTWDCD